MGKKVLIILVNYHTEQETIHFIKKELLPKKKASEIEVAIVDNGSSSPESLKQFANQEENIFYYEPRENLGYLGAAAFAIEKFKEYHTIPELIILANTDIEIPHPDFFDKLIKKYHSAKFGMLGVNISSSSSGNSQNPFLKKRISKNYLKILQLLSSHYLLFTGFRLLSGIKNRIFSKLMRGKSANTLNKEDVYAIHGSFIILSKQFLLSKKPNIFFYESFLFGEEIYLAEMAKRKQLKVIYDPEFKIIHHEHATTAFSIKKTKQQIKYFNESVKYLHKLIYP